MIIPEDVLRFLKGLQENNNREWFASHKKEFEGHQQEALTFFNALMERMRSHDDIEKLKLFRIYRDVRFSPDKTPYQSHFAGALTRAGAARRGGYYVRIKPRETVIVTGFWGPEKKDLLRIRAELEYDSSEFRKITGDNDLRQIWGDIQGSALKTAPKGFDRDHPDIELIKMKQFLFVRKFEDKEVVAKGFLEVVNRSFVAIRPFLDLMSSVLTTNLNGEPLLE